MWLILINYRVGIVEKIDQVVGSGETLKTPKLGFIKKWRYNWTKPIHYEGFKDFA